MDFYLFGYNIFLDLQFLIGLMLGAGIVLSYNFFFRTEFDKRRRAASIKNIKRIKKLVNHQCCLVEEVMWFKKRYFNALDMVKQLEKSNTELGDVVVDLSEAKSKLAADSKTILAERNHFYIECDRLRAENRKLTSPGYVKSTRSVSEGGKIE